MRLAKIGTRDSARETSASKMENVPATIRTEFEPHRDSAGTETEALSDPTTRTQEGGGSPPVKGAENFQNRARD